MACKHKDKNGKSLIKNGVCEKCNEEFGKNFLKKYEDRNKRRKKKYEN